MWESFSEDRFAFKCSRDDCAHLTEKKYTQIKEKKMFSHVDKYKERSIMSLNGRKVVVLVNPLGILLVD